MEYVIGKLKVNGARVPSPRDVGELLQRQTTRKSDNRGVSRLRK